MDPSCFKMCGIVKVFSMVSLQLKDFIDIFSKRMEFIPGSGFLSCGDMTLNLLKLMKNPNPPLS